MPRGLIIFNFINNYPGFYRHKNKSDLLMKHLIFAHPLFSEEFNQIKILVNDKENAYPQIIDNDEKSKYIILGLEKVRSLSINDSIDMNFNSK